MPSAAGRFRSKTSDISDLLHGRPSKHAESHPLPPVPPTPESLTPTKGKRKLNFLRKRKSGTVSPSPSSAAAAEHAFNGASQGIPPVPEVSKKHMALPATTSRSSSSGISSSLPSSLPPLNVSPPSFGHFSHFTPSKARASDVSQTPDPSRPKPFQALRTQKSTSFEFASRNRQALKTQVRGNGGGRPVITISAPPQNVQEDADTFHAPRAAPIPPIPTQPKRSIRKPTMLPFSHRSQNNKDELTVKLPTPTSPTFPAIAPAMTSPPTSPISTTSLSPPLPSQMRFPIPPNVSSGPGRVSQDDSPARRERSNSGDKSATSRTGATCAGDGNAVSRASAQTESQSRGLVVDIEGLPPISTHLRLPDELSPSPTRTRFPTEAAMIAAAVRTRSNSNANSITTATRGARVPPPLNLRSGTIRRSRSPSPARTPPTAPLPDLPPEATSPVRESHASGLSVNSSHGANGGNVPKATPGASTSTNTNNNPPSPSAVMTHHATGIPTIPSMSSLPSRRSVTSIPVPQKVFRSRANTVSIPPAPGVQGVQPTENAILVDRREKEKARERERENDADVLHCISSLVHGKYHHEREREREREKSGKSRLYSEKDQHSHNPTATPSTSTDHTPHPPPSKSRPMRVDPSPIQQHLYGDSAKYDSYIRNLKEMHAAEKAELLKKIEQLEREARKREREIKGLRWLVMNAGPATTTGVEDSNPTPLTDLGTNDRTNGRFRSESKASEMSYASSSGASQHHVEATPALSTIYSPRGSTEEGLYELQSTVSDLIAPYKMTTPPTTSSSSDQASVNAERAYASTSSRRLRRSNTMPDGTPVPVVAGLTTKQARRTSSPVLPALMSPVPSSISRNLISPGTGLGIDMRSIPSIPGSESNLSSAVSESSALTLPSLTTTNTASSSLSAIPESPLPDQHMPIGTQTELAAEKEREKREKDERRASRAFKRLSASSSSNSDLMMSPAANAYINNLKIGLSPSIDQVLERTGTVAAETDMDQVLRKLRSFGRI